MTDAEHEARTVSRVDLYEQIWNRPIRTIAAEYGVSDVALAKVCRKLDVPRPGVGYWARVAHGQNPARPPLPPRRDGTPESVVIRGSQPASPAGQGPARPQPPRVAVSGSLSSPHPATRQLQQELRQRKADETGVIVLPGQDQTPLRVSSVACERALLILDALFKTVSERGHKVELRTRREEHWARFAIKAIVSGQEIDIALTERVRRSDHVLTPAELAKKKRGEYVYPPTYDFTPTGRLTLRLGGPWRVLRHNTWADGEKRRLEKVLGQVVLGLEDGAVRMHESDRRREQERKQEEERRRQRAIAEARAGHQKALAKDLSEMTARWSEAGQIRMFLDAVEERVPGDLKSQGFMAWLAWARGYADSLDPLTGPARIAKVLEPEPNAVLNRPNGF